MIHVIYHWKALDLEIKDLDIMVIQHTEVKLHYLKPEALKHVEIIKV